MSQPPYGNQPPYGGQPDQNPPTYGQPSYGQQDPSGSQPGWGQTPSVPPTYAQPSTPPVPSYNEPTQQFGAPAGGYGGPPYGGPPYGGGPGGGYGTPQPPKKNLLPFIIGGLVLLLVAGGVGLFLLLGGDDDTVVADPPVTAETTTTSSSTEDTETSDTEDTETTDTEDTDTDTNTDDPNFAESEDFAISFVQLMVDGDYDSAFALLCEDGQDATDGDGFADAQALGDDFYATIGATTITDGTTTSVVPAESDRDLVSFDLETDVGTRSIELQVFEENPGELTICGYDSL